MMAQSRAESTRDTYNYRQYINQFPPNTIKVIREFERIQKKICRHKMSIMLNEICIYIYIYIYIYIHTHTHIYILFFALFYPFLMSPYWVNKIRVKSIYNDKRYAQGKGLYMTISSIVLICLPCLYTSKTRLTTKKKKRTKTKQGIERYEKIHAGNIVAGMHLV